MVGGGPHVIPPKGRWSRPNDPRHAQRPRAYASSTGLFEVARGLTRQGMEIALAGFLGRRGSQSKISKPLHPLFSHSRENIWFSLVFCDSPLICRRYAVIRLAFCVCPRTSKTTAGKKQTGAGRAGHRESGPIRYPGDLATVWRAALMATRGQFDRRWGPRGPVLLITPSNVAVVCCFYRFRPLIYLRVFLPFAIDPGLPTARAWELSRGQPQLPYSETIVRKFLGAFRLGRGRGGPGGSPGGAGRDCPVLGSGPQDQGSGKFPCAGGEDPHSWGNLRARASQDQRGKGDKD